MAHRALLPIDEDVTRRGGLGRSLWDVASSTLCDIVELGRAQRRRPVAPPARQSRRRAREIKFFALSPLLLFHCFFHSSRWKNHARETDREDFFPLFVRVLARRLMATPFESGFSSEILYLA